MRSKVPLLAGVMLLALMASVAPVTADDVPEAFEDLEDLEDAIEAGYVLISPCIPDMGFHYVNPADLPGLFEDETVIALLFHEDDLIGIEEVILLPPGVTPPPGSGFEPIPEPPGLFGRHTFFETPPSFAECPLPPPPLGPEDPEGETIVEVGLDQVHLPGGPFGFTPLFLDATTGEVNPTFVVTEGDSLVITINNVEIIHAPIPHNVIIQDEEGEILARAATIFPSGSSTLIFDAEDEGTFWYICEFHGLTMRGQIIVEEDEDD